jgi:hypothetical protein
VIQCCQGLDKEISERQKDAATANDKFLLSFQGLRKTEIVRGHYDEAVKLEEARREQIGLVGLTQNVCRQNKR